MEFSSGRSVQFCLKELRQDEQELYENGPIYLKQVEIDNNGHDWGICYDVNEWAKDEDGELGYVHDFLIKQARDSGLQVVAHRCARYRNSGYAQIERAFNTTRASAIGTRVVLNLKGGG